MSLQGVSLRKISQDCFLKKEFTDISIINLNDPLIYKEILFLEKTFECKAKINVYNFSKY